MYTQRDIATRLELRAPHQAPSGVYVYTCKLDIFMHLSQDMLTSTYYSGFIKVLVLCTLFIT